MEIGYEFKNKKLLNRALTHISFAKETGEESNQRLEFLGDSILSYVIAHKLYELYPKCQEGVLTEMRAYLVCEKSLAELSEKMELGKYIKFSKTEIKTRGKRKNSILADTFEALLGAIYLDSNIEKAEEWVLKTFDGRLENIEYKDIVSYKSALQNLIQAKYKDKMNIAYKLISKKGPDHAPTFTVEVAIGGKIFGTGSGSSLKSAEKTAAKEAYYKLTDKAPGMEE